MVHLVHVYITDYYKIYLNAINMEKKITKEDYLRKKGLLPPKPFGTMFSFESTRKGVSEIKEALIWDIKQVTSRYKDGNNEWAEYIVDHYKLNESPYNPCIRRGETVGSKEGHGSGFGDLWAWTWFSSLDKSELEKARQKEIQRIAKKYGVNSNQTEIIFPAG